MNSSIRLSEILNNKMNLSPNNYNKVTIESTKVEKLGNLILSIDKGNEVGGQSYTDKSEFKFIRTSALNNESLILLEDNNSVLNIVPDAFIDLNLKKYDVLVCKDSNVGEVVMITDNMPNYMFSSGINRINIKQNSKYIFAVMKNKKFQQQLLSLIPKGATLKHAKDIYLDCIIPFPNDQSVINYIEDMIDIILNKEILIKKRFEKINKIINDEIVNNQINNQCTYTYPKFSELSNINRLDVGNYTEEFKMIDYKLKNYKNGFFYINSKNIKGGNTPKSRFIDVDKSLRFNWITPSYINNDGSIKYDYKITCDKNNVNEDCAFIINRTSKGGIGEYVGITSFYNYELNGPAQHNQGIYKIYKYSKKELITITCLMNSDLYRKYCANLSMGSKMKELKLNNVLAIPFPKLSKEIVEVICNLYYNEKTKKELISKNFVNQNYEWDEQAGLLDLFKSMLNAREELNNIIDNIYENKSINLVYKIF